MILSLVFISLMFKKNLIHFSSTQKYLLKLIDLRCNFHNIFKINWYNPNKILTEKFFFLFYELLWHLICNTTWGLFITWIFIVFSEQSAIDSCIFFPPSHSMAHGRHFYFSFIPSVWMVSIMQWQIIWKTIYYIILETCVFE